jgi:riboflavin kinase/FMN adenylyltransferase
MELIRGLHNLRPRHRDCVATIGAFDGVHLGHQAVIDAAVQDARADGGIAVVVTFDPHPVSVIQPGKAPRLLASTRHKILLLERLGVDHLLIINFDEEFSRWTGEQFIEALVAACQPLGQVCVGNEWSFGYQRSGDIHLLQRLGEVHGFDVTGVPAVALEGEIVSSTIVRQAIREGDFARAATFLGRDYTVLGTVIEGEHLGSKIGFPTANLTVHSEQLPPGGVYLVQVMLGERKLHGVGNLGYRPTVAGSEARKMLEIHLLDHHENIYGSDMEVFFLKYLRPEIKFENVQALSEQIAEDVETARASLAASGS